MNLGELGGVMMNLGKVALLALALAISGCGTKYMVKGTPSAPDADGKIVASVMSANQLTQITLEAEHLAPPDRLFAGATSYVVWARQDSNSEWLRIAKLDYDAGDRKGAVKVATVPLTAFELAVSAEQQDAPKSPSTNIVFSQKISP